jgi:hypothetical protein
LFEKAMLGVENGGWGGMSSAPSQDADADVPMEDREEAEGHQDADVPMEDREEAEGH